jgi:hypothetical protein
MCLQIIVASTDAQALTFINASICRNFGAPTSITAKNQPIFSDLLGCQGASASEGRGEQCLVLCRLDLDRFLSLQNVCALGQFDGQNVVREVRFDLGRIDIVRQCGRTKERA